MARLCILLLLTAQALAKETDCGDACPVRVNTLLQSHTKKSVQLEEMDPALGVALAATVEGFQLLQTATQDIAKLAAGHAGMQALGEELKIVVDALNFTREYEWPAIEKDAAGIEDIEEGPVDIEAGASVKVVPQMTLDISGVAGAMAPMKEAGAHMAITAKDSNIPGLFEKVNALNEAIAATEGYFRAIEKTSETIAASVVFSPANLANHDGATNMAGIP